MKNLRLRSILLPYRWMVALLVFFLCLSSCVSSQRIVKLDAERLRQAIPKPTIDYFQQLVDNNKLLEAYAQLQGLKDDALDSVWLQQQQSSLLEKLKQQYRQFNQQSDLRKWLRWQQSALALGFNESSQQYWDGVFSYYQRLNQTGPALAAIQQALLNSSQFALNPAMEELLNEQWSPVKNLEQMLLGSVLVEVDLGLSTKWGIGMPNSELGSGFFVDNDGYLLTNYHVIANVVDPKYEGYAKAYVRLSWQDGRVPAKVIGWDLGRDLALLKIEVKPRLVLPLSSAKLNGGDTVFAIGSPAGLASSISRGALSSRSRQILPLTDVLQIDAAISPGSSGGPLVNEKGEVVGVVFLKVASEGFEGLGFAIPVSTVYAVLPALYAGGEVKNNWLGVIIDESKDGYLEVRYVVPTSPADVGGVLPGDRLISFNDIPIISIAAALLTVPFIVQGALSHLQVERNGKQIDLYTLSQLRWKNPIEGMLDKDSSANLFYAFFGAELELVNTNNRFRVKNVIADSVAFNYGFDSGDLLQLQWIILDKEEQLVVLATAVSKKQGRVPSRLLLNSPLDSYQIL